MNPKSKGGELPSTIGPYQIVSSLGQGGMGEVFLAKDPSCDREVALKRIRPDLAKNPTILKRFLREAHVASSLNHPSIVPIFAIEAKGPDVYYTMPYVEGETLRKILKGTKEEERRGERSIGASIPALARIFLQVCEAIAYTHSRGILHRDVKPENIIVGKYGEVMILDWGIADFIEEIEKGEAPLPEIKGGSTLTRPGKVTGTLAYMAPERLKGRSSSIQTDLYALGVILYQILTLQLPFQRKTIQEFRRQVEGEMLIDPIERAPYRDIPHSLARACVRCLSPKVEERQQSVQELIDEIKSFIEGRPEWILAQSLSPDREEDWQFQENILLAKHIAITRSLNVTEWAGLMVSKRSFANNLRLEAKVRFGEEGEGVGLLLSVPEAHERKSLEEGYCLWLGAPRHPVCQLYRNNLLVVEAKRLPLEVGRWHQISVEKVEDHLRVYLDGVLRLSFVSHLPLAGTHVGLLQRDGDFELSELSVYDGSQNVMVGCLAVPNALLSHKLYDAALLDYRRLGESFRGRMEGREALFRAGMTLLEKGKAAPSQEAQEKQFMLALKEFEKLSQTPGAPFEYLGKALVYQALGDAEEEAKCLELCLRKFPRHPLLPVVKEQILYRMHESSQNNREAAYRIILLAIRHIPNLLDNADTLILLDSLESNWEMPPFFERGGDRLQLLALQLSFWLRKIPILVEIGKELDDESLLGNALFGLLELEAVEALETFLPKQPLTISSLSTKLPSELPFSDARSLWHLMKEGLTHKKVKEVLKLASALRKVRVPKAMRVHFDALEVWGELLQGDLTAAKKGLERYDPSDLAQESSPLHFPYGVWLYLKKGPKEARRHFSQLLETPYPPTTSLPSHFLMERIGDESGWMERAFWWEKKELYRQLELFHRCAGKK